MVRMKEEERTEVCQLRFTNHFRSFKRRGKEKWTKFFEILKYFSGASQIFGEESKKWSEVNAHVITTA